MKLKKKSNESAVSSLEQQITKARQLIKRMKALPNDFRDCMPGSSDWMAFYTDFPLKREEMDLWLHGPVVSLGFITEEDKYYIGKDREYLEIDLYKPTVEDTMGSFELEWLIAICRSYDSEGYCLLYLPKYPTVIATALNNLLSLFHWNIRCKGKIEV